LSDTGIEQRLHVLPVERLLALLRKRGRNCCLVEIGAVTLGQQVKAEEIARAVAFVEGRN
jgi:stage V sporulation protein SpoVS